MPATLKSSKKSENRWKAATNNKPHIIATLVAQSFRAFTVWADPHNEPFYLRPLSQAVDGRPRKMVVNPVDGTARQVTPDADDPNLIKPSEPALQITFSRKPKHPELGYLIGSDRDLCDIFLGSADDLISQFMFTMSFNQYNEVIMTSVSRNDIVVSYGKQEAQRRNFNWIFPSTKESISVTASEAIKFTVEVPAHVTDKASYETNCRNFMWLANSAGNFLDLPNLSSQSLAGPAGGVTTSQAPAESPFYLRTRKLGGGGFGKVYKARSMPDGRIVAVKRFKSKRAWKLEARVLRKIAKTPHENIIQFIDLGLVDKPYLVMGFAVGGDLEDQNRYKPFTMREIALILRQMLDALVYLHVGFNIIHRDIKPANILCETRSHFRLADFGLAKEGQVLETIKGTRPYMAPEMFANKPYSAAVDLWALGLVIARFLSDISPQGFQGDEGPRWCAALVTHFEEYEERSRTAGVSEPEQIGLTIMVAQHMLKFKPEERQSAAGCLEQGGFLWWMLDQVSDNISATPPGEDSRGSFPDTPSLNDSSDSSEEVFGSEGEDVSEGGENETSGDHDSKEETEHLDGQTLRSSEWASLERQFAVNDAGDHDSEAETELLDGRTLRSSEWASLERQFAVNNADLEGSGINLNGPQHFINAELTTSGSSGQLGPYLFQDNLGPSTQRRSSQGLRPACPLAPMGVRKSSYKRSKSTLSKSNAERVAAFAAQQAADEQSRSKANAAS